MLRTRLETSTVTPAVPGAVRLAAWSAFVVGKPLPRCSVDQRIQVGQSPQRLSGDGDSKTLVGRLQPLGRLRCGIERLPTPQHGVDLEVFGIYRFPPGEGSLSYTGALNYLNGKIRSGPYDGRTVEGSPEWTYTATLTYRRPLVGDWRMSASASRVISVRLWRSARRRRTSRAAAATGSIAEYSLDSRTNSSRDRSGADIAFDNSCFRASIDAMRSDEMLVMP